MESISREKVEIVVDNREERSGIVDLLKGYNLEILKRNLAIGDYFIDGKVVVERKTVIDFKSSLVNGRLFEQLLLLKKWCDKSVLIIEGDLSAINGLDHNALLGAIVSIAVFWQLPILFTKHLQDTARFINIIALQVNKSNGNKSIRHYLKKKGFSSGKFKERLLEVIPSIGPMTAKNLLQHFGSIEKILQSSEKELAGLNGIGLTRAKAIKSIVTDSTGNVTNRKI